MLDTISNKLDRLSDDITRLPDGPGKVWLLERLVATYDKLIELCKRAAECGRTVAETGPAPSARPRSRRSTQETAEKTSNGPVRSRRSGRRKGGQ